MTGTVISCIGSPEALDSLDSSRVSDEPLNDVESEERLPWEHLLDEPLKEVISLKNKDDVDLYMY
ncbi:uncharacterized protein PHACADRAFT_266280 [Phanerochaete carnosa HHB-10118-sp]|uniref:Uncharacterized protein n=1 Tax=Phanerochaete carnosa (strain HHB-10118-sp) TaxID=650164 RepID=K5VPD5_PHACS|nr:uncharacterized protein PHACADRAFT_266280 [Phanerochaete carnosa HHB-10118-sp]EKM48585.1 hypothetical protein PHACADRAFT_266280 [Phanerochaete carnosa HHB-10118-sp]